MDKVLSSAALIASKSKYVSCSTDGIEKAAHFILKNMKTENYSLKSWKEHGLHPSIANDDALNWIFVVDTLNFSFWSDADPPFSVLYKEKKYTGYWSLCAALNKALEAGIPITDPKFYAKIDIDTLKKVFHSETDDPVPMLEDRLKNLQEVGTKLVNDYEGSARKFVESCENSAVSMVNKVIKEFPCFLDSGIFEGDEVYFLKRAQIIVADVWACFENQNIGFFKDIDELTMFADYRVPQVMVFLEILKYTPEFLQRLENKEMFKNGDREEMEIRGCSIHGVELVKQKIKELVKNKNEIPNAIILDFHLWDYAKAHGDAMQSIPIHRVRSIYY